MAAEITAGATPRAGGRRAKQRATTEVALRWAAITLIRERGYEATKTEDIAHAAGVSPRTFFNYFPTKESVFFFGEDMLPVLIVSSIRSRPTGEDPVATMAAAALETFRAIATTTRADGDGLLLATLQVTLEEEACRARLHERRALAEHVAWTTLQERGVSVHDFATRSAVTAVVALAFLALSLWVEAGGVEELPTVLAHCLVSSPDPARLAAGLVSPAG